MLFAQHWSSGPNAVCAWAEQRCGVLECRMSEAKVAILQSIAAECGDTPASTNSMTEAALNRGRPELRGDVRGVGARVEAAAVAAAAAAASGGDVTLDEDDFDGHAVAPEFAESADGSVGS
jgi:hypothetical protein